LINGVDVHGAGWPACQSTPSQSPAGATNTLHTAISLLTGGLRELPVGTAYAAWTGIGAVGTAAVGMIWFGDSPGLLRVGSVALIVAGVVGLNLAGSDDH
jgi:quaternary ammonium compound-resistance protein SugE